MPDDTTILSLPLILPAQAQKHVTHNEALVALDVIVQLAVIDRDRTAPPALPSVGDRHIVASGATAEWVGQAGRIALYAETGWQFTAPLAGWRAHVLAEGATAVFDGLVWKTPAESPLSVPQLGVAATADAVNRLTVSAPATLLNHAGGGHQLKLNKAADTDTASLLFQTGFSGRAEMGTAGTDDFAMKVSADGAAFVTALQAEAATGEVTLPQPLHLGGQAADPVAPPDGTMWLNTTTGEVKVQTAGATLPVGGAGAGLADGDKGDITVSGGGSVWSIDAGAVGLAQMADIATGTILGRATAGVGVPEALTGPQATALLDTFTGGAKGLVPASGGGTTSFLRADGSWTAPPGGGGGGTPAGAAGAVQWNDGGAFAGAADVAIEGGQLRLPATATPAAPAAGGVKLFATALKPGGPHMATLNPDGLMRYVQEDLSEFNQRFWIPNGNGTGVLSSMDTSNIGGASASNNSIMSYHLMRPRIEYRGATAADSIAGLRAADNMYRVGRDANAPGGFYACIVGGNAGGANTTRRSFMGMFSSAAPTDIEPSDRTNIIGMGLDAGDANHSIMHNSGSGTATKIDLGSGFARASANRVYTDELQLYSPNSLTQSVTYRAIRWASDGKTIAAEASGTITANLPDVGTLLAPTFFESAGGTSTRVDVSVMGMFVGTEY